MTIKATIYRGEVRQVLPTHEHPDPSEHLAADPQGFMKKWMSANYPYPENYYGMGAVTTGQHWTRSPEVIPERFTEGVTNKPQPGVAMGKSEKLAVGRRYWLDQAHHNEPTWDYHRDIGAPREEWDQKEAAHKAAMAEHHATISKYEKYLAGAERKGINTYADLSGGDPDRPGAAKPYRMGVIWHGEMPDEYEHGTNYEDELNLPAGSHVRVTGARLFIPKTGIHQSTMGEQHPSTFTPTEFHNAMFDAVHRSTYSAVQRTTSVPWNRMQFPDPVNLPIEGRKYWSR